MAVISFLKIIALTRKSYRLQRYRENKNLMKTMNKIEIGCGLHVGWSIEGAIGSEFKIDASYLSPNVNLASRLNAATL